MTTMADTWILTTLREPRSKTIEDENLQFELPPPAPTPQATQTAAAGKSPKKKKQKQKTAFIWKDDLVQLIIDALIKINRSVNTIDFLSFFCRRLKIVHCAELVPPANDQ